MQRALRDPGDRSNKRNGDLDAVAEKQIEGSQECLCILWLV